MTNDIRAFRRSGLPFIMYPAPSCTRRDDRPMWMSCVVTVHLSVRRICSHTPL